MSFEADEMSYYFFLDEYILNLTVGGLHNFRSLSIFYIYSRISCLVLHNFKRNIYFFAIGQMIIFSMSFNLGRLSQ